MIELELPYPPSGNHAWKHARGRHYLTDEAKRYYEQVGWLVRSKGLAMGLDCRLVVSCEIAPPDKRRRDLDNVWKVLGDACTKAGVWEDDTLIDRLVLQRMGPVAGGLVRLRVAQVGAE